MPLYDYSCECGKRFEAWHLLMDYRKDTYCKCGKLATKVITAPAIVTDYPGYECPVSGKWIEGRKAHEENLRRTGCRVFEPGEREAGIARRSAEDSALEAAVDATVEAEIAAMPTAKREALASELASGVDVVVTRN